MNEPSPAEPRTGTSRMRVLQALREAPEGLGAQELAEQLGLHVNTVRFHLDRLVDDGGLPVTPRSAVRRDGHD